MDRCCEVQDYLLSNSPITEECNPLSYEIDLMTPGELVVVFDRIDHEIYNLESKCYHGILDVNTAKTINSICNHLTLKANSSIGGDGQEFSLIFSGSGTSGRIGFITYRNFSRQLEGHIELKYLISGGDPALVTSCEAFEDDADAGVRDLKEAQNGKACTLIGITCGMHSPYVGGQLDYCLANCDDSFSGLPVLLGFNQIKQASKICINKSGKSFFDLALEMSKEQELPLVINPVLKPELLTGSSRMKGGTATKIILDSLLICIVSKVKFGQHIQYQSIASFFKNSLRLAYQDKGTLAHFITKAGKTLNQGGHLYYLGVDNYGIFGLLDASECVPTFGASQDDVRGFVAQGYDCLGNRGGHQSHLEISLDYFRINVLPKLTTNDCVIVIGISKHISYVSELACSVSEHGSFVGIVLINDTMEPCIDHGMVHPTLVVGEETLKGDCKSLFSVNKTLIDESASDLLHQCVLELSVKLILNAISTGAFIVCGKVLQNFMIDIRISNIKLFHRAVRIISKFTELTEEESTHLLLCALYRTDEVSTDIKNMEIQKHAEVGAITDKVVPIAILMCLGKCSVKEAIELLSKTTHVRKCLSSFLQKGSN